MKALICLVLNHDWRYIKPVNSKTFDYWSCARCGAKVDVP